MTTIYVHVVSEPSKVDCSAHTGQTSPFDRSTVYLAFLADNQNTRLTFSGRRNELLAMLERARVAVETAVLPVEALIAEATEGAAA